MTISTYNLKQPKTIGQSLVEILVAMSIFTVAIGGLFMATNASKQNLAKSMKIDIEAQYAQLLINEVNVNRLDVTSFYDETTKQQLILPNGNSAWWTRDVTVYDDVDNTSDAFDVLAISVYFFKNQTDTTPYRKFNTVVDQKIRNYNLEDSGATANSMPVLKETTGMVWTRLQRSDLFDFASADIKAGLDTTQMGGVMPNTTSQFTSENGGLVAGTHDASASDPNRVWRRGFWPGHATSNLYFRFPASKDQSYKVTLGFNCYEETYVAGDMIFDININGTTVDTVDLLDETSLYTLHQKSYTATPVLTSGIYALNIEVKTNGSPQRVRMQGIQIEKQ